MTCKSASQALVLDDNRLTSLPGSVGELACLERLSVNGNALAQLPASIGSLKRLVSLSVARNKLSGLPFSLGGCSALEDIDASDNYLQAGLTSVRLHEELLVLALGHLVFINCHRQHDQPIAPIVSADDCCCIPADCQDIASAQ